MKRVFEAYLCSVHLLCQTVVKYLQQKTKKHLDFIYISNLAFQNIYKVGLISEVTANFEAGSGRGNIY